MKAVAFMHLYWLENSQMHGSCSGTVTSLIVKLPMLVVKLVKKRAFDGASEPNPCP